MRAAWLFGHMPPALQVRMMTWSELLHRLVLVQGTTRLCAVRDLDELDIVGRVMRKENYLIGMLNAGVLGLYVKGLGPFGGRRFMLTKTLEWNLYLCILDPMFDDHFHIKQVCAWVGTSWDQAAGGHSLTCQP